MNPAKPKATEHRKLWLATLRPGDEVYLWRACSGWHRAEVSGLGSRITFVVRLERDGFSDPYGVSRLTGVSVERGEFRSAVYRLDDPSAQKGYESDQVRRSLCGVSWATVSDYSIARIAEVLRQDREGGE